MNLESRKYHLIEKIVSLQDESMLKRMEQILSAQQQPTTIRKVVKPITKENGIIQRRSSVYRISDRPKVIVTKNTATKVTQPLRRVVQPVVKKVVTQSSNSSLGKLQRLVRERALVNHTLDI